MEAFFVSVGQMELKELPLVVLAELVLGVELELRQEQEVGLELQQEGQQELRLVGLPA